MFVCSGEITLMNKLPRRFYEARSYVGADVDRIFTDLDDQVKLSSHMSESSWTMGGGRMKVEFGEGHGRKVGSTIRLTGSAFGLELSVDERVTERDPPYRKVWETIGRPSLVVIGSYRMGFELSPDGGGSQLRVFIEYELPMTIVGRRLGVVFGPLFAKCCKHQMVDGAIKQFSVGATRSNRIAKVLRYRVGGEGVNTAVIVGDAVGLFLGPSTTRRNVQRTPECNAPFPITVLRSRKDTFSHVKCQSRRLRVSHHPGRVFRTLFALLCRLAARIHGGDRDALPWLRNQPGTPRNVSARILPRYTVHRAGRIFCRVGVRSRLERALVRTKDDCRPSCRSALRSIP